MKATETDVLIARAQAAKPSRFRRVVLFLAIRFEWRWLWRLYVSLLVATLVAGCAFQAVGGETVTDWRERYPGLNPAGTCSTVWVTGGLGCFVLADDSDTPRQCVAAKYPGVMSLTGGECELGWNNGCDCDNQVQEVVR